MNVKLAKPYRGIKTEDAILEAGEHELDDDFAEYLIDKGYAVAMGIVETAKKAVTRRKKTS